MFKYLAAAAMVIAPAAAFADSGREQLTQTAFAARDKAAALAQIASVEAAANATLARAPGDSEAQMTRAMAVSYRAKLSKSRTDALAAKAQFEALAAKNPRDAEAQAAIGAWHLNAVEALGGFAARAALGARKATGVVAIDRSVALGGGRALFPGLAALLRLSLDPKDAAAPALLDAAAKGSTPTTLDRLIQRRAVQVAAVVKGGDPRLIQTLAKRLLPLGQFK
ncbi:hypothetical protein [Sphingomonas sp. HMP6]|uniref:hypothetical protein n=1 Tax=Sphingomonas sp. HMP6 TaxID=1517551 RepID=UPI001597A448|nr:hypothetical protein [Sphingomonas sp. HMP6]BCA59029.1 hypothetical protein HMP06_1798 [Sphingomonas sp. HMP6]